MNTRTIAESWAVFERLCLNPKSPDIQRREMKRAFYSGFQGALIIGLDIAGNDVSEAAGVAVLQGLHEECTLFIGDIQAGRA